jgi:predicted HicB family RNase H-like nuclease
MLNLTKISVVLLTLGLATSATAEEVSLEQLVSQTLSMSVVSIQQQLNIDIQGAVLTTVNQFNIYEEKTYAAKISSSDLDSHSEEKAKQTAE